MESKLYAKSYYALHILLWITERWLIESPKALLLCSLVHNAWRLPPPPTLIKEVWNCIDHRCSRHVMPTCMAWLCLQASLEKQVLTAVEYSDNFPLPQGSTKRYIIPLTSQTTTCICSTALGCIEQCYFLFYLRFVYKKTQNNHFQCAEIMEWMWRNRRKGWNQFW